MGIDEIVEDMINFLKQRGLMNNTYGKNCQPRGTDW